jgi:hypothetical protein
MATFFEANQARLRLKMKLSEYSWYTSSAVISDDVGYAVVVLVKAITNSVRKVIPPVINGVSVRTDSE